LPIFCFCMTASFEHEGDIARAIRLTLSTKR
jgi:hypothetical protein